VTSIAEAILGQVLPPLGATLAVAAEQAARQLAASGAIPPTAIPGLPIARTVVTRLTTLLDIQVSDLIVGGLQLATSTAAAARQTAATSGTYRQIRLSSITIPWRHEMDVDVLINRRTISSVTFIATADITISTFTIIVRDGAITAITNGDTDLQAQLNARITTPVSVTVPLAYTRRSLDLRAEIYLPGQGIPLIPGRARPHSPHVR
jgi:hypothetical protein